MLNTNGRHGSETTLSTSRAAVLVDVLDPAGTQYTVGAGGALAVTVPAQRALVLVPITD